MQSLKILNKKVLRLVSMPTKLHCNFFAQQIENFLYILHSVFFALFLEHKNICCNRFLRATQCQVQCSMATHSFLIFMQHYCNLLFRFPLIITFFHVCTQGYLWEGDNSRCISSASHVDTLIDLNKLLCIVTCSNTIKRAANTNFFEKCFLLLGRINFPFYSKYFYVNFLLF